VSKGNPIGFLDSEDEEVVDKMGHDWRLRRTGRMTGDEWEEVARFLLMHMVDFVDSELVETDEDMKKFDLILSILGEDGSVDGEGRKRISDAYLKLARDRDESYQQQDDVEGKLEARDRMIAGLKEELKSLSTRRDSPDLEKLLASKTLTIAMWHRQIGWRRRWRLPSGRQRRQKRRQRRSGGHGRRRRHR